MNKNTKFAAIAAAAALFAIPGAAQAGTQSSNMGVSAVVTGNCTISTSPVAFGNVNTLDPAAIDATGGITVTCTKKTNWAASAGAGAGAGATTAVRKMTAGTDVLNYSLYTDAARTTLWGDTSGQTITSVGTGVAQPFVIYGRIPGGQNSAPAGNYADTVAVTVTY